MKKFVFFCIATAVFVFTVHAQSLEDNADYRKSLELREQSLEAFDNGDYAEAKALAEQAQEFSKKSELWVADQLAKYRANSALKRVKARIQDIKRSGLQASFPEEYGKGTQLHAKAKQDFQSEQWENSRSNSLQALKAFSSIGVKPAAYVVRYIEGNTDCLWKIAQYDFIYGSAEAWETLYKANKNKLPDRDNPHLIYPDTVLRIPSRNGEKREGTWSNGKVSYK